MAGARNAFADAADPPSVVGGRASGDRAGTTGRVSARATAGGAGPNAMGLLGAREAAALLLFVARFTAVA